MVIEMSLKLTDWTNINHGVSNSKNDRWCRFLDLSDLPTPSEDMEYAEQVFVEINAHYSSPIELPNEPIWVVSFPTNKIFAKLYYMNKCPSNNVKEIKEHINIFLIRISSLLSFI